MREDVVREVAAAAVRSGQVPQLAVAAADRDGELLRVAVGPRTAGGDEPLAVDAVFRIASMTKVVTSVAALQLVERGRLGLDDPVARYLPEFGRLPVLTGFDDVGRPVLRPPVRAATVRDLLTHTAGLGYWFFDADVLRWHRWTGTPLMTSGKLASFETPLIADPGERFSYGTATDWLGRVVEQVAGVGLAAYFDAEVTGPLGMVDTTFRPSATQRTRLVPVHRRNAEGVWRGTDVDWPTDPDFFTGGHGLYSTAGDFLRFQRMLLCGGALDGVRVLGEATVAAIFRGQLGDRVFPARIATAHPASSADLVLGSGLDWGFGLVLTRTDTPGGRAAGSGAWYGIHNTHFWVDRSGGITAAVYAQVLPFADSAVFAVLARVESALYTSWHETI
jgi:CubicO group peptidase (beta-lactamase class C family)